MTNQGIFEYYQREAERVYAEQLLAEQHREPQPGSMEWFAEQKRRNESR